MQAHNGKAESSDEASTALRVKAYLERQLRWLEAALNRMEELSESLDADAIEKLTEQAGRDEQDLDTFLREQHVLLREWRATQSASEDLTRVIQTLARQNTLAAKRLIEARARAQQRIDRALQENQAAMKALKQGRALMRRYDSHMRDSEYFERQV